MNSVQIWEQDCVKYTKSTDDEKDGIYDVVASHDSKTLLVAVRRLVLVLDLFDGESTNVIKSHEKSVYSVSFSADDSLFATGSADKLVIIWSRAGKGQLKYAHEGSVQSLKFNPMQKLLLSCSSGEFVLCSPAHKKVRRTRVEGRIVSSEWIADGSIFAIGFENGEVEVRDAETVEVYQIFERSGPVWCLGFIADQSGDNDENDSRLVVASWDETVSMYNIHSNYCYFDKSLDFLPCAMQVFIYNKSTYIMIAGSEGHVYVYSKEGALLVCFDKADSWILSIHVLNSFNSEYFETHHADTFFKTMDSCPNGSKLGPLVVSGSTEGMLRVQFLCIKKIEAQCRGKIASTESFNKVSVLDLISGKKVAMQLPEVVENISLCHNQLSVLHKRYASIYVIKESDPTSMDYLYNHRVYISRDQEDTTICYSNFFGFPSSLILAQSSTLSFYNAARTYSKTEVIPNSVNFSSDMIHCKEIFSGYAHGSIVCVLSNKEIYIVDVKTRTKCYLLATSYKSVDRVVYNPVKEVLFVQYNNEGILYSIENSQKIFMENNILHADFSTQLGDTFVVLHRRGKITEYDLNEDSWDGLQEPESSIRNVGANLIDGFTNIYIKQREIFYTKDTQAVNTLRLPTNLQIENNLHKSKASQLAAYLKSYTDKEADDETALQMYLLHDVHLSLFWQHLKQLDLNSNIAGSLLKIYQGDIKNGTAELAEAGDVSRALDILKKLRLFDDAKALVQNFAQSETMKSNNLKEEVTMLQAYDLKEKNEVSRALDLLCEVGAYTQALDMAQGLESGQKEAHIQLMRAVDESHVDILTKIGQYFEYNGFRKYMKECYFKIKDIDTLVHAFLRQDSFKEAWALSQQNGGRFEDEINYSYGVFLAMHDQYELAQVCFSKVAQNEDNVLLLFKLIRTYHGLGDYKGASYFLSLFAKSLLEHKINEMDYEEISHQGVRKLASFLRLYQNIYQSAAKPFSEEHCADDVLFNTSAYLLNVWPFLGETSARNFFSGRMVSRSLLLQTMGEAGVKVGAHNACQRPWRELGQVYTNSCAWEQVNYAEMLCSCNDPVDQEEYQLVCYRCTYKTAYQELFDGQGKYHQAECCPNCLQPFFRSAASMDLLPLVEFTLSENVTDADIRSIKTQFDSSSSGEEPDDLFHVIPSEEQAGTFKPVEISLLDLSKLDSQHWFAFSEDGDRRFYKNVIPDIELSMCESCGSFFNQGDIDVAVFENSNSCLVCNQSFSF